MLYILGIIGFFVGVFGTKYIIRYIMDKYFKEEEEK